MRRLPSLSNLAELPWKTEAFSRERAFVLLLYFAYSFVGARFLEVGPRLRTTLLLGGHQAKIK